MSMSAEHTIDSRVVSERLLYKRLVLASHDLDEAREYLRSVAAFASSPSGDRTDRAIVSALVTSFVVSYGRCFVGSELGEKELPRVPERGRRKLSVDERSLHDRLIALRNREFAHSDAEVADIRVGVTPSGTLVPTSRVLRRYSLSDNDLAAAGSPVRKMSAFVTDELIRLQDRLAPYGEF
jgi:hypothetical protein